MAENETVKTAARNDVRRETVGQSFDAAAIGMTAAGIGLAITERDTVAAGRDAAQRSASMQASDIADTPVISLLQASDIWQVEIAHAQGSERADASHPAVPANEVDAITGNTARAGGHNPDRTFASEASDPPHGAADTTDAASTPGGGSALDNAGGGSAGSLFQNPLHEISSHTADISASITSNLTAVANYMNNTIDSIVDQVLGGRDTGLGTMLTSTIDQIATGPASLLEDIGNVAGLQGDLLSSTSPLASLPPALLGATNALAPDQTFKTAFGAPSEFASGVVNTISLADFDSGPPVALGFLGQTYTDHPDIAGHGVGTMLHGFV